MNKELLAPVGNMESLYQAVFNGADAVYLAGKRFGARAFADNFTNEELIQAIKFCHLYDVKIYITINTIIYEKELEDVLSYVKFLYVNQVDAVIVQDIGLIKEIRNRFPNLEVHASTQMNIHNLEQIKILENLGVKRVVLARELSLDEIQKLNTKMELEVFIHGAMCISYSGQCLFSSLLLNRSGNRGSCAGLCRLPYKLLEEDKEIKTNGNYLLSPKELNTMDNFKELMQSNIFSFKIEGRMKSPEYVGFITNLYRKLIDNYELKKDYIIGEEEIKNLKLLYNRDFTKGHLFNQKNADLMNILSPNHQGIYLGEVISYDKNKIKIKLAEDLSQGDGIRFSNNEGLIVNYLYNEKGLLINQAKKGEYVLVLNKVNLKKKGKVLKTLDFNLLNKLKKKEEKKIKIKWIIEAFINKPLKITISDGKNYLSEEGNVVKKAINQPTDEEMILSKLSSLGETPFMMENYICNMDNNIFINMSELKKIKHSLTNKLKETRENKKNVDLVINEEIELENNFRKNKGIFYTALVRNEEQLKACLEENLTCIYVDDEELYNKYKKFTNVFLRLSRIMNNYKNYEKERLLGGEIGSIKYSKDNKLVGDYFLNVVNSSSVNFFLKQGLERVTLSIENNLENIKDIAKNINCDLEYVIYGKPEIMITKYCPLNYLVNKDKVCLVCHNQKKYYLESQAKKKYEVKSNAKYHLTHIFYHENIDKIEDKEDFIKAGVNFFRMDFLNENAQDVKNIINKLKC